MTASQLQGLLEGLGALLVSGAWVLTLMLLADRLLGVPTGLLLNTDPASEQRVQQLVTRSMMKRRLYLAPLVLLTPTGAVTLAAAHLAGERLHSDLAWYVMGLALLGAYTIVQGSVYWLKRLKQ